MTNETPDTPTAPGAAAVPAASSPRPARVGMAVLLGACAGLALLAVGGGGLALGLALADDDPTLAASVEPAAQLAAGATAPPAESVPAESVPLDPAPAGSVSSDTGALVAAIDAAVRLAGGEGATGIDTLRLGWEVDVRQADGATVEVFVPADGATPSAGRPDPDRYPDPLLDTARIDGVVAAAVAAAGGGTVDSIETSDDRDHAYEVALFLADGTEVDVELAGDLSVTRVDYDD